MSTTDYAADDRKANDQPHLDSRDVRALTESMTVMDLVGLAKDADDLYVVVSTSEYLVDVREGACTCPDFEHNLPAADGRETCKHLARVTYETGMRPVPGWVDRDALDDQLLAAEHVDGEPRFTDEQGTQEPDYERCGAETADGSPCKIRAGSCPHHGDESARAVADGGRTRPADCSCTAPTERDDDRELPCFQCWNAGFDVVNSEVRADE